MSLASVGRKGLLVGPKTLRRGSTGEAVKELQRMLRALGYDTGEIDGRFGFITEDALLQFQREHRLRADGVAGAQVFEALKTAPAHGRIVHVVRPGERLFDVADRYHVPVELICRMNRISRSSKLFPGQRLVIRSSCVMAGIVEPINAITLRSLTDYPQLCSAIVDCTPTLGRDGTIDFQIDPQGKGLVSQHGWSYLLGLGFKKADDDDTLYHILRRGKTIRQFVQHVTQLVQDQAIHGIVWDVSDIRLGQGRRLLTCIEQIRRALPRTTLALAMAPPAMGLRSLISDVDYDALSKLVDYSIVSTHDWKTLLGNARRERDEHGHPVPLGQRVAQYLTRMTRFFPPWKVLLGVALGASLWQEGQLVHTIPYRGAITEGYIHRKRPQKDPSGLLRFTVDDEATGSDYVLQGAQSLHQLLSAMQFYRLGGAFLYPIGYEDRRHLELIAKRIVARPLHP